MLVSEDPKKVEDILVSMATSLRKLRKGEIAIERGVFPAKTKALMHRTNEKFECMLAQYRQISESLQLDASPWLDAWLATQGIRVNALLGYELHIPDIKTTILITGELSKAQLYSRLTPTWPAIAFTLRSPMCRVTPSKGATITAPLSEVLSMPVIASASSSYYTTTAVKLLKTEGGEPEAGQVLLPIKQRERERLEKGAYVLSELAITVHT